MINNEHSDFLKSVVDSLAIQVAVIDESGVITFVNRGWVDAGRENGMPSGEEWVGVNYLNACADAGASGDRYGELALEGLQAVISGARSTFYLEYPCHSPEHRHWFLMRAAPLAAPSPGYFVISHADITERKIAEDEVRRISRLDGLTGINNRRSLDDFLEEEWRRCARLGLPLTLLLADIDHFKIFNDSYGHHAGDECLKLVASTLDKFARRPGDLCARYGGEEFALVLGNTRVEDARHLFEEIRQAVQGLELDNSRAPVTGTVTVSIGAATAYPALGGSILALMQEADRRLYRAKQGGRNRVVATQSD